MTRSRTRALALAAAAGAMTVVTVAEAQYPPQPQPPPYLQPQPYPPQPQPYPPQPYPPQQYPPQQYPPQPQPYGQPPVASNKRGSGEMAFLYGTSIGYGLGTGIWIDGLGKVTDPGLAFIAPIAFGAAMPIGLYFWDDASTLNRGVPASMATGLLLGAVEGMAISGVQWQYTNNGSDSTWSFRTQSTVTFLTATAGGVGGYLYGEAVNPDPRRLGFIASGGAWGAIAGTLFGAGVTPRRDDASKADWKDSASVAGLIGYNTGILATGALSLFLPPPSWRAQKAMWLGFAGGTVAASIVYVFYIGNDAPVWHGLIANSIGGLAGVGLMAALRGGEPDEDASVQRRAFNPPVNFSIMPLPKGGAALSAFGAF